MHPHQQGRRHDEVQRRVVVTTEDRQHRYTLQPAVEPELGIEVQEGLQAQEIVAHPHRLAGGGVGHGAGAGVGVVQDHQHQHLDPPDRQAGGLVAQAPHYAPLERRTRARRRARAPLRPRAGPHARTDRRTNRRDGPERLDSSLSIPLLNSMSRSQPSRADPSFTTPPPGGNSPPARPPGSSP